MREAHTAQAQRVAAWLALVREMDVRGHARTLGYTSTAAWLAAELLIDRPAATAQVRTAHQLDPSGDVPPEAGVVVFRPRGSEAPLAATGRALAEGKVSLAHTQAISLVIRRLPQQRSVAAQHDLNAQVEAALLAECHHLPPADIRRCGARAQHLIDPDGVLADERDAAARATFWIKPVIDGAGYRFGGTTDAVTGAQLATLIDAHAKPRPVRDPDTGVLEPDPRRPETRRGHAFADLVRLAANADESVSGGTSTNLVITATVDTLMASLGQRGIACGDTETGHALSAATIRLLACDTTIIPIMLGANSEPLDVARATRTIPTAIRRALVNRDKHCAFPGCDRPPRWADGHHITHWADGGDTALNNLVLLCGHHHDLIHHTGWTVHIEHGRPRFTAPPVTGSRRGRPPPRTA